MKRLAPSLRRPAAFACTLLLLVLYGCGATKNHYPGATEQQQRSEASASEPVSASTDTAVTYLKLVDQMQREELWFASLAHIDALEQRWGASPDSMRMRADALRQTGQANESRKLYTKLMGTPLEAAGYRGLGLLAGGEADYGQAVRMLEQAQRRTPTDGLLLSDLGYARMRAGRIADARVPLMQALQLTPDNAQVQVNAALYLQASGQSAQADALMDAHRMPPATRTAIGEAARGLSSASAAVPTVTVAIAPAPTALATVAPTPNADAAPQEGRQPLALRTSSWPRRVHVLVRPQADEPSPPATTANAAEILQPLPPPGAQP